MVAVMEPALPSPMATALNAALFGFVLSCATLWVVTNNSCQSHQHHCYSSNSASFPLGFASMILPSFCSIVVSWSNSCFNFNSMSLF
ncbi:hypothetical protein AHAS_Ahas03G0231500 [Arachis hypogaea]